ncbi:MAG: hypothetical protein ACE5PT_13295, partial [Gemmatimonadales bacterium]
DRLMAPGRPSPSDQDRIRRELGVQRTAIERILSQAANVLGVLTQELGMAVAPSLDEAVLEKLELMDLSHDRLLMVLVLRGGAARTIFVEAASRLPGGAVTSVSQVLNERLAGLTLVEIRRTLRDRLRDAAHTPGETELLNIFVEEADQLFQAHSSTEDELLLGSTRPLTGQPEFSSKEQMRTLLELTEHRDLLRTALKQRRGPGLTVTIGGENLDPKLSRFTLVTSSYRSGSFSGVIGVMGPTRMPYQKVVALVEHTSRLIGDLLE